MSGFPHTVLLRVFMFAVTVNISGPLPVMDRSGFLATMDMEACGQMVAGETITGRRAIEKSMTGGIVTGETMTEKIVAGEIRALFRCTDSAGLR
jgi:hypothetical protein